jgi:hypothetical protein
MIILGTLAVGVIASLLLPAKDEAERRKHSSASKS